MSTVRACLMPPHVVIYGVFLQYIFMDLLKSYCTDDSSSEETENTCVEESLDNSEVRSVYLVTHSQADIVKFASREDFAQAIVTAFSQGKAKVVHWCCCREQHKKSGEHYHLSLKLDRNQRWLNAKRYLLREYSISVHFSSKHHNYYSAWRYVTKCDNNFIESAGHPYLGKNSEPPTSSASRARHSKKR